MFSNAHTLLRTARHGSFLVYGLIIMTFVSILLTGVITFVATHISVSIQTVARDQAFQVAESGVNWYRWYLAHMTDGRTAQQIQAFWAGGTALGVTDPYEVEYRDDSGPIGKYRITVTPPEDGSTIVSVLAEGWTYKSPATIRSIRVRFRRPSWSEYSALANDAMRFGQGTEVFGKVHSNLGIRFDGVAHNVVSSSLAAYDDPDHAGNNELGVHTHVNAPPASGVNDTFRASEAATVTPVPSRTDVFAAGRSFPVPSVDFNGVLADLNLMKSEAQAGHGQYLGTLANARRKIILKTNGTFDVCTVSGYSAANKEPTSYARTTGNGTCAACSGNCATNYPIVDNGVIFSEANTWVEGQINDKRATVVAANMTTASAYSLYITHNILYTNTDGRDILGLIGQGDVEVTGGSDNVLRIDGALLAQQGRVGHAYYGDHKNTITVNGAIGTNQRYGFAWTDGTGYATRNLYFDNNLLYYPPPYFPTGTQYLMDLWEEL
jgi:hypothetical protein